ncbi:hypothetical protein HXX01_04875 [Candidatus Nomurabacteria bacterium]|nr:hypothetical protein [Candidatus Nomurabacteria bacterium]
MAVSEVLELVGVNRRRCDDIGVRKKTVITDESVMERVYKGIELPGKVIKSYKLGVFVECEHLEQIWMTLPEVEECFTKSALEVFPEGASCSCRVLDIHYGNKNYLELLIVPAGLNPVYIKEAE